MDSNTEQVVLFCPFTRKPCVDKDIEGKATQCAMFGLTGCSIMEWLIQQTNQQYSVTATSVAPDPQEIELPGINWFPPSGGKK